MDYKEKYEQALEVAQRFYNNSVAITKKGLEEIFPELKESEDERIVKELLTFFRESIHGGHILTNKEYDSWISWLEKQGEQNPAEEYNITGIGSKHAQGKLGEMIKNLKPVNEVLEQNHTWSEQDEKMFNSALWHVKNSSGNGGKNSGEFEVYNWLKSLKERYTWKPSDEQIRRLEYFLKLWGKTEDIENTKVFETVKSLLNDLKKLK